MTEHAKHLSELCKGSDVDAILHRLEQIVPEPETTGGESERSTYLDGVWGFRDGDGRTAFHWAVAVQNFALATTLMEPSFASPVLTEDEEGITPFATACAVGAPESFLETLLQRSVDVYGEFVNCRAAHCSSSVQEHESTGPKDVSAEAARCSVVNGSDRTGNTPLLSAASRGRKNLVEWLLQRGAQLNSQNTRGQTALHRAVSRGNMELVEFLVTTSEANNADSKAVHRQWMNLQDYRGDTALFYASMENNEEIGRYLIRHGADRDQRNKAGKQFWEV